MIARSLDDALAPISDGCVLAVPRESSGVAMAATRALIRRGIKRLTVIALPTSSLQADLPMADREGNVWVGRQRELITMAHASERTIVTVEKLHDGNLLEDKTLAAGTLPGFYVETVALVENGCWPLPLPEYYAWDVEHLKEYVKLAATDEGFAKYLDQHVYEKKAA